MERLGILPHERNGGRGSHEDVKTPNGSFRFALLVLSASASGCGSMPMQMMPPVIQCPALSGTVVTHSTDVTASERWDGDGVLHQVTASFTVRPNVTLTLGPCAVVRVNARQLITLQSSTLRSEGTAERPVRIEGLDDAKWLGVRTLNSQSFIDLSHTTFSDGPMLVTGAGGTTEVIQTVRLRNVTLADVEGPALKLEAAAGLSDDSEELTISHSGTTSSGVLELGPLALNTLPRTMHFVGNPLTEIKVKGTLAIERDVTIKNLGASYHFVFDRVRVYSSTGSPILTIEPGVTARFDDMLRIGFSNVGARDFQRGRLIAVGGPGPDRILLTSAKATQLAGDWPGVWLEYAAGSRLENVIIDKAGGFNGLVSSNCKPGGSSDAAALNVGWPGVIYEAGPNDFANVTIRQSASHGINAMWEADGFGSDLTLGFTFESIAGCKQTRNARFIGCANEAGCFVE